MSEQKSADTLRVTITASATIAQVHTLRPSGSEIVAFYEREQGKPLVNRAAPTFKIRDEDEPIIKRAAERAMDEASVLQRKLAPMPKPKPLTRTERIALEGAIKDAKAGLAAGVSVANAERAIALSGQLPKAMKGALKGQVCAFTASVESRLWRYGGTSQSQDVVWDARTGQRTVLNPEAENQLNTPPEPPQKLDELESKFNELERNAPPPEPLTTEERQRLREYLETTPLRTEPPPKPEPPAPTLRDSAQSIVNRMRHHHHRNDQLALKHAIDKLQQALDAEGGDE